MLCFPSFGCVFIQHCNTSCVFTIYKNGCIAPDLGTTGSREDNTNSFLMINAGVRKANSPQKIATGEKEKRAKKPLNTGMLTKNCYLIGRSKKSHSKLKI